MTLTLVLEHALEFNASDLYREKLEAFAGGNLESNSVYLLASAIQVELISELVHREEQGRFGGVIFDAMSTTLFGPVPAILTHWPDIAVLNEN